MIYFIGPEWPNLVKIGHAYSMRVRLSQLQLYCPMELTLYGVCDGDFGDEAQYHERFRPLWHRGEWFRHEDPIREFIRDHCQRWYPESEARPRTHTYHKRDTFCLTCAEAYQAKWFGLAISLGKSYHEVLMVACEEYAATKGFEPAPARQTCTRRPPRPVTAREDSFAQVNVKSSAEWVQWLARFAKSEGSRVSPFARHALDLFARNLNETA